MSRLAAAVLPAEKTRPLVDSVLEGLGSSWTEGSGDSFCSLPSGSYFEACNRLLADTGLNLDYLSLYTAVHRAGRFDLFLVLTSTVTGHKASLHTSIPDDGVTVTSLREIFPGAHWYEREMHEMFGIGFSGLPDEDRLLLASDIVGSPLRKDFVDDRAEWMVEPKPEPEPEPESEGETAGE